MSVIVSISGRSSRGSLSGRVIENPYEEIVKQAETKARELKIRLKKPSLSAIDVPVCEENPLRNLYISADGEVSPCVYLYPPLPSPFKRIFCSKEYWQEKVSFGNIFGDPVSAIWNRGNYEQFRNRFSEREKGVQGVIRFTLG